MIKQITLVLVVFACMQSVQAHRLAFNPFEFELGESKCFLLEGNATGEGQPWVWYAPTLPRHPDGSHTWYVDRLLAKGISLAGCDQGEVRGSPKSVEVFTKFYHEMVRRGYSKKPVLLGQSRGGLMMLSWAVRNPKRVGGFAGIYPVLNLRSWPMKRNLGPTLADFGMDQDAQQIEQFFHGSCSARENNEGVAYAEECFQPFFDVRHHHQGIDDRIW